MHGRSIRRARARRIVVGTAAAVTVAAASALPALAHPGFSAAAGFGFAPNTSGGTGAVGSTPPYAPGTTQTLHLRVPFEQTEPFNGSDDTTVDVQVVVPNGWTNPVIACRPPFSQHARAAGHSAVVRVGHGHPWDDMG